MKFGFIAKHRGIWPVLWMCEALGVSRGGFYAWVTRPRSRRSRADEELGAKVRRQLPWQRPHLWSQAGVEGTLLAEGVFSGLHRIERLMRSQALRSTSAPASAAARSGGAASLLRRRSERTRSHL